MTVDFSSSTIRSAVLRPIPGIAWKRATSSRTIARQLRRPRAGHDRERDLRADAVHAEQLYEQLALGRVGEAVELEDVLADVQVRLDGDLVAALDAAVGVAWTR